MSIKASGSAGKPFISVWEVEKYFYCPRKIYFLKTLGMPFQPKRKVKEGKSQHQRELKRMQERKDLFGFPIEDVLRVYNKLYIEDAAIGLLGQVDTVLQLKDDTVIPVEVKYTELAEVTRPRRKQLIAYSILLEKRLNRSVDSGILYFPIQNRQVTISISSSDKQTLLGDLDRIRELMRSERVPPRVRIEHCEYCEFYRHCWS